VLLSNFAEKEYTVQIGIELDKPNGYKQTPELVFLDYVISRTGLLLIWGVSTYSQSQQRISEIANFIG